MTSGTTFGFSYKAMFLMLKDEITWQEFEKRVAKGERLVILEHMVLDIKDYPMYHPGGKFVLEKNIGRDITKFYYGAYAM